VCAIGRNFDASEAVTLGLVSRVLPNVDELTKAVMGLANDIADKSPVAVYGTKVRTHTRESGDVVVRGEHAVEVPRGRGCSG
jgi:enoyl-CoA hydratase/carnithine racemase